MTRQSKKLIAVPSKEFFEESFAKYNEATSKLQVLEGGMNAEITAIKERYENKIGRLQEQKEECFEVMQVYAESSPDLFAKKKSLETTFGIIGFQTNPPRLATRKGFKWPAVLEIIRDRFTQYLRTKEEPNKELILADRETLEQSGDLKAMGLDVVQDETFYVKPSLELVSSV